MTTGLWVAILKDIKKRKILPDVAFVGFPPIEVAYYMACWLKKNKNSLSY